MYCSRNQLDSKSLSDLIPLLFLRNQAVFDNLREFSLYSFQYRPHQKIIRPVIADKKFCYIMFQNMLSDLCFQKTAQLLFLKIQFPVPDKKHDFPIVCSCEIVLMNSCFVSLYVIENTVIVSAFPYPVTVYFFYRNGRLYASWDFQRFLFVGNAAS